MGLIARSWLEKLHPVSPYQDFNYQDFPVDLQGWGSKHPIFEQLITELQPHLILEVGTWKGASALHMASILRQQQLDAAIICIDTWLGGIEHVLPLGDRPPDLQAFQRHGYPTLYYQFLANVMHTELHDYIVPFPNTSSIAARWLSFHAVQADLVYIDASHDAEDVYQDLVNYWDLVRLNGVMLGDDWRAEWPGVISAVTRFVEQQGGKVNLELANNKWLLRKLPDPTQLQIAQLQERLSMVEQFLQELTSLWTPSEE